MTNEENPQNPSAPVTASGIPTWKRVLDIACIIVASPLLIPLGIFLTILIKIVSPGPALFKQERIGFKGKPFRCLKFRTMQINADTNVHREHLTELITKNQVLKKLDSGADKRVIPGGAWLRSIGVDEMPQVINVLRGEMSLVGPRPCVPYEYEQFPPRYKRRCDTLPGLTGLWQVSGKNKTTFDEMMNLDVRYVEKKSLWLDLRILAMTIPAMVGQAWDLKKSRKLALKKGGAGANRGFKDQSTKQNIASGIIVER